MNRRRRHTGFSSALLEPQAFRGEQLRGMAELARMQHLDRPPTGVRESFGRPKNCARERRRFLGGKVYRAGRTNVKSRNPITD